MKERGGRKQEGPVKEKYFSFGLLLPKVTGIEEEGYTRTNHHSLATSLWGTE